MAINGIPDRRAALTASYRQQANPQAAPVSQGMTPAAQAPQSSQGGSGSFYGNMGGGSKGGDFYSGLGGGMSRPSQTRMANPAPMSSMGMPQLQQQPPTPAVQPQAIPRTPDPLFAWAIANGMDPEDVNTKSAYARTMGQGAAPGAQLPAMPPMPNNSPPIMGGPPPVTYGWDNGTMPDVRPTQTTPPMTSPSESFPASPQRSAPVQSATPPDMVTQAPPMSGRRGPGDKGSDAPGTPRTGAANPDGMRSVWDRPSFNATPQRQRAADVDYGMGQPAPYRAFGANMAGGEWWDMYGREKVQQAQMQAQQARARMQAQQAPRFAFGTDNSAQYQANGMGNSWIPSTNNSYAQGKQIPPALQRLIDLGMPIPPALLNSVTGGQSGPLNMASAFTARGGGSLPSMQGMDRMSQDEREAFGGYLTGPIGMPEASTMDSIGRPTSNLQTAARSRIG